MEGEKKDLQSLLREAANIKQLSENPTKEEIMEKAEALVEYNMDNKWDKVKEMMEGPFADRFLTEMESLSGREFIRVYGKMIEFFKPKIVRVEGAKEAQEDNVLRIEVYNSTKPAIEDKTIDITHEEDGTE